MAAATSLNSLEQWLPKLTQSSLPLLPQSKTALRKLLRDPEVALAAIAKLVDRDPVLQVHLIRDCNRHFGDRALGRLTHTSHCVAMLGLDRLQPLLKQLAATPDITDEPLQQAYFDAVNLSFHSAALAASWTEFRNPRQANEMHLAAILAGVPSWCLWQFAAREMAVIQQLWRHYNIPVEEAELAVLGCTLRDLAAAISQQWQFPEHMVAALSRSALPSLGFLWRSTRRYEKDRNCHLPNRTPTGKLVNTPALAISLSHSLATEIHSSWFSHQTNRLLRITATYLDQPYQRIRRATMEASLNFSNACYIPQALAPASGLLWPTQPRRRRLVPPAQVPPLVASLLATDTASLMAGKQNTDTATDNPNNPENDSITVAPVIKPAVESAAAEKSIAPATASAPPPGSSLGPFLSVAAKKKFETFFKSYQTAAVMTESQACEQLLSQLVACTTLQRALLLKKEPAGQPLSAQFAQGCDDWPLLKKLKISLQPINLLTRLTNKPAASWMNPNHANNRGNIVPGTLKQAADCEQFFVMSVFQGSECFGILYADAHQQGLSELEYKLFRVCGKALSKRLALAP